MKSRLLAASAVSALFTASFFVGCEHSDSADGLSWTQQQQQQTAASGQASSGSASSGQASQPAQSSQAGSSGTAQSSSGSAQPSSAASSVSQPAAAASGTGTAAATPATDASGTSSGTGGASAGDGAASGGNSGGDGDGDAGGSATAADQAPFGAFQWKYGGMRGGGAAASGVSISGVSFSRNGLTFRYVRDLSAWGYSSGALGGIACLFVKNNSGAWVGGKFDHISSSRQSRDFNNVYSGYSGWSLADVPNPCQAAFVIISPDAKKRSNVLVGTWSR